MAHHQITFKRNEDGTYYAACSCGPTFASAPTRDEVLKYMEGHVQGLGIAFGVNTVGWSMNEPPTEIPDAVEAPAKQDFTEAQAGFRTGHKLKVAKGAT